MKKKITCLSAFVAVLVAVGCISFGCTDEIGQQEEVIGGTPISEEKLNKVIEQYDMTDYISTRGNESKYDNLKAIRTEEELDAVLDFISRNFSIGHSRHDDVNVDKFLFPLLKTRSEGGQQTASISGENKDGVVTVFLDYNVPMVLNSTFYSKPGFLDAILAYEHVSGSAYGMQYITFSAYGEMIIKILWQSVEIKRISTTIHGNFDRTTGRGELTQF